MPITPSVILWNLNNPQLEKVMYRRKRHRPSIHPRPVITHPHQEDPRAIPPVKKGLGVSSSPT